MKTRQSTLFAITAALASSLVFAAPSAEKACMKKAKADNAEAMKSCKEKKGDEKKACKKDAKAAYAAAKEACKAPAAGTEAAPAAAPEAAPAAGGAQ